MVERDNALRIKLTLPSSFRELLLLIDSYITKWNLEIPVQIWLNDKILISTEDQYDLIQNEDVLILKDSHGRVIDLPRLLTASSPADSTPYNHSCTPVPAHSTPYNRLRNPVAAHSASYKQSCSPVPTHSTSYKQSFSPVPKLRIDDDYESQPMGHLMTEYARRYRKFALPKPNGPPVEQVAYEPIPFVGTTTNRESFGPKPLPKEPTEIRVEHQPIPFKGNTTYRTEYDRKPLPEPIDVEKMVSTVPPIPFKGTTTNRDTYTCPEKLMVYLEPASREI